MSTVGYRKTPSRTNTVEDPILKRGDQESYSKLSEFYELDTAIVVEVLTKTKDPGLTGAILCKSVNGDTEELTLAFPLNPNVKQYPVRNEIVLIGEHGPSPRIFYQTINYTNSPNYNGDTSLISDIDDSNSESKLNANNRLHNLTPNVGDTIIQGRYGSGIRFSNKEGEVDATYSPITIITNGYNGGIIDAEGNYSLKENITNDGSTIILSAAAVSDNLVPKLYKDLIQKESFISKAYEFSSSFRENIENDPPFDPSTWRNFREEPVYNGHEFPRVIDGDQLILSSDRIILTSKVGELLNFSKGQIGFFTDNKFSIDAKNGVDLASPNAQFTARFDRINLNSPNVFLGIQDDRGQPALLGNNTLLYLNIMLNSQVQFLKTAAAFLESAERSGKIKIPGFSGAFKNQAQFIELVLLDGIDGPGFINPNYKNLMLSNKVFVGSNELTYTV